MLWCLFLCLLLRVIPNRRPIGHQARIVFLSLSLFLYFIYYFLLILFHYINSDSWITVTHSVPYMALAAASFFGTDGSISISLLEQQNSSDCCWCWNNQCTWPSWRPLYHPLFPCNYLCITPLINRSVSFHF